MYKTTTDTKLDESRFNLLENAIRHVITDYLGVDDEKALSSKKVKLQALEFIVEVSN